MDIKEIEKTINRLQSIRERYLGGTETQHGVLAYFWNDVDKLLTHIKGLEAENEKFRELLQEGLELTKPISDALSKDKK